MRLIDGLREAGLFLKRPSDPDKLIARLHSAGMRSTIGGLEDSLSRLGDYLSQPDIPSDLRLKAAAKFLEVYGVQSHLNKDYPLLIDALDRREMQPLRTAVRLVIESGDLSPLYLLKINKVFDDFGARSQTNFANQASPAAKGVFGEVVIERARQCMIGGQFHEAMETRGLFDGLTQDQEVRFIRAAISNVGSIHDPDEALQAAQTLRVGFERLAETNIQKTTLRSLYDTYANAVERSASCVERVQHYEVLAYLSGVLKTDPAILVPRFARDLEIRNFFGGYAECVVSAMDRLISTIVASEFGADDRHLAAIGKALANQTNATEPALETARFVRAYWGGFNVLPNVPAVTVDLQGRVTYPRGLLEKPFTTPRGISLLTNSSGEIGIYVRQFHKPASPEVSRENWQPLRYGRSFDFGSLTEDAMAAFPEGDGRRDKIRTAHFNAMSSLLSAANARPNDFPATALQPLIEAHQLRLSPPQPEQRTNVPALQGQGGPR